MTESNEQTLKTFIAEQKAKALTVEWVHLMLTILESANNANALRASGGSIIYHPYATQRILEPQMIYA